MPPITFTLHAPHGEAQDLHIQEALNKAFTEAVAAQPGLTVQEAVEFSLRQYVLAAKHFAGEEQPPRS